MPGKPVRLLAAGALVLTALSAPVVAASSAAAAVTDPASVVDPFIGTENGGNDFPGADSPFGMVQFSPDTTSRPPGGGYSYADSSILGFSLTHVAGPGDAAAGDFPILPTTDAVDYNETQSFTHSAESADAGYYSVTTANGVKTELTTTPRSGMAQFTFPATTQANLLFKMTDSENADSNVQFNVVSSTEVDGQVTTGDFGGHSPLYNVYFDAVFSRPFTSSSGSSAGDGYVTFDTTSDQVVQAKIGLSYVSVANATANRTAENPNWDFAGTQTAAHDAWNSMLGRISIGGGTSAQQQTFYTALYHSLLYPQLFSDSNGQYTGVDGKVHTVDSGHSGFYTTFSGWDIYRTQAQLSALVAPSVASDIAQSMVDDYAQSGRFPKWMLDDGESYDMAGDPADPILADYYAFGARNFDTATALKDMIAEATGPDNDIRPGLTYLEQLGYLPDDGNYTGAEHYYGSASTTLEYDTADAAISFLAGDLGESTDQATFLARAQDWQNLFDSSSGFIQPRNESGGFTAGFTPTGGGGYCCDSPSVYFIEGDSWQYTPMVPFDISGLVQAEGGDAAMTSFLNTDLSSFTGANGYADLTNEPSLNIPWEYDYVGEPYQTQATIREIQDQIWTDTPGGLPGNDDLGTMSAWYVWSALGMYPETPGTSDLALGSPMFTQESVTLPSGNTLTIDGANAADDAPYIQSATWADGTSSTAAAWNDAYLPTTALADGGTLDFTLGTSADTSWATAASAAPPSYQPAAPSYSDTGVSDDATPTGADFDGQGNSYSAEALAAAGVIPGASIEADGLYFTWPDVASGQPDNYEANGQVVPLTGSGSISFLGSSDSGPSTGTATVTYTDGTTQNVGFTLSDWTLNGGTASTASGDTIAVTAAYRNRSTGPNTIDTYLFATTPVALTAGKTVASVRLPSNSSQGGLHVFAIATQTGPILSGAGPSQCADDYHSETVAGNKIQIHPCNGTDAQQWTPGSNGSLSVLGMCMDTAGGATASGTLVELATCDGSASEVWAPAENGTLVNTDSHLCLDAPSTVSGTQLEISTCTGSAGELWSLP
jgi:predicted alpha-1,2-mannosidase